MSQPKTRMERRAEQEAELQTKDQEAAAALARLSLAQRLGVRPGELTDEQLAAHGLDRTPGEVAAAALFPSAPEVRRRVLEAIAEANGKYARPFEKGKVASLSLVGTESWADYGGVVLQMAILDTLLSIEQKLGDLLPGAGQD